MDALAVLKGSSAMHSLEGVFDDKVLISDFYRCRYVSGSDSLDSQVDPALGGKYYLKSS